MGRSARRRSAPSSPAKPRAATTSPRQTRRSHQAANNQPTQGIGDSSSHNLRQLPTIDENDNNVTVNARTSRQLASKELTNTSVDVDETANSSISADSISAESEDSDELAKIDRDLVVDNLEALNHDSQSLLSLFASGSASDVVDEIQDLSSKNSRRFRNFLHRLQTDAEPCGRGPRLFLPVPRLLRALNDGSPSNSGAEIILLRANLAIFVSMLVIETSTEEIDQLSELLQYLTLPNSFPQTFMEQQTEVEIVDEQFRSQTVSLGLAILTQSFIDHAQKSTAGSEFDPESLLESLFSDDEGIIRDLTQGVAPAKAKDNIRRATQKRLREIRKDVRQADKGSVNVVNLRNKFTWRSFIEQSISWATTRDEQIRQKIVAYGGVEAIRSNLDALPTITRPGDDKEENISEAGRNEKALEEGTAFLRDMDERLDAEDEEEDSNEGSQSQAQLLPEEGPNATPEKGRRKGQASSQSTKTTKASNRQTIPESPQAQQLQAEDVQSQQDEHQNNFDNAQANVDNLSLDEQEVPNSAQAPHPTQETLNVLNVTRRQERESNKENSPPTRLRLIDRQPNARKIHFDHDDDDDTQVQNRRHQKRRHEESEISEGEDEFETDTRQTKKPRTQSGKSAVHDPHQQQEATSNMFVTDSDDSQYRSQRKAASRTSHAASTRKAKPPNTRPESSGAQRASRENYDSTVLASASQTRSQLDNMPPVSSYEEYLEVKQKAQQNLRLAALVAASSSAGQAFRSTQVRKAWTADEVRRLMDLMEEYGTSWAKIKEADSNFAVPLLGNRSQVQLKDKARNMKLDFLKAEQPLPDYFDGVTISKSHKEQLRRMNIGLPRDTLEEE